MMGDDDYPEVIDLTDNNLKTEAIKDLINTFKSKLTRLILSGNHVCVDGALTLSLKTETMANLKLEYIDMTNAKLNDKGGSILIKSLERCRNLVNLNLSENELGNMSGEALYE